ncbi:protein PIGMENT DEFECTIVE 338, chloroplastic-like [Aristolochia californica]|uniref:protein PIGMENT DEFECTIVE 338, chloroplastic-like n=1 Tax=Aristolochia californica TaxID=171875 RepID=UPI0035D6044A
MAAVLHSSTFSSNFCQSSQVLCGFSSNISASYTRKSFLSCPAQTTSKRIVGLSSVRGKSHVLFCAPIDYIRQGNFRLCLSAKPNDEVELELLGKPSPVVPPSPGSTIEVEVTDSQKAQIDEVLAPFLKFFKAKDSLEAQDDKELEVSDEKKEKEPKTVKKVKVEYYDPKPGDFVVGVVVSGNENKLDVNVGADLLGSMLTKEVLPLYGEELPYLQCDLAKDAEEFMAPGKIGIVKDEEAFNRELMPGRPVVEVGTVVFSEVLGRTLSGRPLLSTRRLFRRVAWHRVRQIKQFNEPIEVKISEWNTGGLLTRIEGLRAFLPKAELVKRVYSFAALKENVGRKMFVLINRIDEAKNDLIISEREAWDMLHLREGTLLDGTIRKIFPYGAQVRIGETNRSGLLHISNITRGQFKSVSELLSVDERVKVLVVKSMFPDKISLSIADLESEPGMLISNKEKVFSEAEKMAQKYREKLPTWLVTRKSDPISPQVLPFDDEAKLYANWSWFTFQREKEPKAD